MRYRGASIRSRIGHLFAYWGAMYPTLESHIALNSWRQSPLGRLYLAERLNGNGLLAFEYPLYRATDEEMDQFLGGLVRSVSRAASNVVKHVSKVAGNVLRPIGKVINTVGKFVPIDLLTAGLRYTPLGMAAIAGLGAARAAASGKNPFQGALRAVVSNPLTRMAVDTLGGVIRGNNPLKALKEGARGVLDDVKQSLRFAATVAPFVPGIGTGLGAVLGAANALASGERITDALIAGVRGAVPGGAIAQAGFEAAVNLAKGKPIAQALLAGIRSKLPGGPAAQAAFDTGLALAQGQNIQNALITGGGRLLPKSPYSADALSFVRNVANGADPGKAALSGLGNFAVKRVERRMGPIFA